MQQGSDDNLKAMPRGSVIDVCSEFSGIGGFEHGLEAGFNEAQSKMLLRLIEASELDGTSFGRHATAVLQKRFPACIVLGPESRAAFPGTTLRISGPAAAASMKALP